MIEVNGLDKIEQIANAQKKIKELNKKHFDRVVNQYITNGVDPEVAKVMAKSMIDLHLA
jgi:hypothetical protein